MNVTCFRVENSFVKLSLSLCLEADIFHKGEYKEEHKGKKIAVKSGWCET